MEESSLNFETDRQKTIGVRRRRLVGNESCVRRRGRVWCAPEEWRSGVGIYREMARVGALERPMWVEKCVRSIDLLQLPVNLVMNRSVSNVCRNRRPGKPVTAIVTNVSRNRRLDNPVSTFGRKFSPNHLQLQTSWQRPEWINSHQCTSWPFCPLDGLRFFIRRRMGLITIDFFLLLTTVFFFIFLFFCSRPFFLDLTSHIATLLTFLPS